MFQTALELLDLMSDTTQLMIGGSGCGVSGVQLLGAQSVLEPARILEFAFQSTFNSVLLVAWPCFRIPRAFIVCFLSRLAISSS